MWNVDTKDVERNIARAMKMFGPDPVEDVTEGGAKIVYDELHRRTPRGPTGNLVRSIKVKRLERRWQKPAPHIAAMDRRIAPHAWLVEKGPYKRPYFRPAVEAKRGEVARHLENGLRRLVEGFR